MSREVRIAAVDVDRETDLLGQGLVDLQTGQLRGVGVRRQYERVSGHDDRVQILIPGRLTPSP